MGSALRGLGTIGVVAALGSGCLVTETNLGYCANINGDVFCAQRHEGEDLFCLYGSDECLGGLPPEQRDDLDFDGCVQEQPSAECYSPCGGGQSEVDDGACFFGGTGGSTTSDVSADGTGTWTGQGPVCGNGELEGGEECDGADLGGEDCGSKGFDEGELGCNDDCTFELTGCVSWSCGNDMREGGEVCDGADLSGQSCEIMGFGGGTLACGSECNSFDFSGCTKCGNGMVEPGETCDGTDLGGETCASFGLSGGVLACNGDCLGFDVSGCTDCGNGVIEPGEACDGADLNGWACQTFGFSAGSLACDIDCLALDTSSCVA